MSESDPEYEKYVNDSRIPCKYGVKCYQKNPVHLQKYKHPPGKKDNKKVTHVAKKMKVETKDKKVVTKNDVSDSDDYNIDDDSDSDVAKKQTLKVNNEVSDTDDETDIEEKYSDKSNSDHEVENLDIGDSNHEKDKEINQSNGDSGKTPQQDNKGDEKEKTHFTGPKQQKITDTFKLDNLDDGKEGSSTGNTDSAKFIKDKFLVKMPKDFYQFWTFCTKLRSSNPLDALRDIGLSLVGPFDVLAGKFKNVTKSNEEFLIHWRYYRDPPEFQTILKGDDKTGYHIGYFRDSPDDLPVFLCSNPSKKDGILTQIGENIFAALNFYLEDMKKSGDPFKKMHIGRVQTALKKEAETLKLDLSKKTNAMVAREKKIVTRTFNKIGLVVPFDKKTELGYRALALDNKDLNVLLTKLQNAKSSEEKTKYRSELQPVFTFASIAADECDFGTSIELGWNLIAHGIDSLDTIISNFLSTGYKLLQREAFAKIAEAHMKNRRQGSNLSIL